MNAQTHPTDNEYQLNDGTLGFFCNLSDCLWFPFLPCIAAVAAALPSWMVGVLH